MLILDIIFKIGEFTTDEVNNNLSDFFIAVVGAFIGSAATVAVYYGQIRYDRKKTENQRIKFQAEKVAFLKISSEQTISLIKTQIECYKEFLEKVKDDDFYIPSLLEPPLNDLDLLINKINREEFFHSYINEFNKNGVKTNTLIEEFKSLFLCFYAFDKNFQKIQKLYTECNRNNVTSTQIFEEFKNTIKQDVSKVHTVNRNITTSQLLIDTVNIGFARVLESKNNEDYYVKLNEFSNEVLQFITQFSEAANLYFTILKALHTFESKNTNVRRVKEYISKFLEKANTLTSNLETSSSRLLNSK